MGWLEKIAASSKSLVPRANLPVPQARPGAPQTPSPLPNATIIYGIGGSLLFVAAFFLLVQGHWFPALVVFALGVCLLGFAMHLLKHQD